MPGMDPLSASLSPHPAPATSCRGLDLLLSEDPRQRLRIARALTSMLVYGVCIGATEYAVRHQLIPGGTARWLQGSLLVWAMLVYLALRSGWNQRFTDPALTQPQIFGAQTLIAASYLICHPFRGSLMMLLALVLVFGIFNLDARGRRLTNIYTVVLMAATMTLTVILHPGSETLEGIHFVLMATILPVVSVLGAQLSATRANLVSKKAALEDALQRIQAMAIRDELTGLYNRRHMLELLDQQIKRQERAGGSWTICLFDLDHFKRINDSYGHTVGDDVLRHFAEIARFTLRETDVLARWGGEEFLLMLPDTPQDLAVLSIERIRQSMRCAPLVPEHPDLHVTFSAGVTEYQPGEVVRTTIERADRALYRAKAEGRNCTRPGEL
ncbi:MAG: GGDEF domain-containing protein [Rubrivivax sp.]|nr:MAG: GGDEF domain-containing protein [Rubrivivax sp.]